MVNRSTIIFAIITIILIGAIVFLLFKLSWLPFMGNTPVATPTNSPRINIGIRIDDSPGFNQRVGKHRFGFDIDLANYISNKLGRTPVFVPISADQRNQSLLQGDVDMVISTYSITDERIKAGVVFAGPYMRTFQGIIVNKDDNTINSINDLKGKIVCALKGTTSYDNLSKLENVYVTQEDTLDQCIQDIKDKNADAASSDAIILQTYAHKDASLKFLPHLRVPAPYEEYGIGFSKNNMSLCQQSGQFLKDFVVDSNWDSSYNAYLQPLGVAEKADENILTLKPDLQDIDLNSCKLI